MSATRDDLLTVLAHRFGFALEVPFGGLSGTRRWRWDAAIPERKIALEYSGYGPGHQWNAGVRRDQAKLTEGALCGFTVIVCNSDSVSSGDCLRWVETALWLRASAAEGAEPCPF